jgi:hypothetical protein
VLLTIGDRIVLAPDGADANAAEREDAGLDRCLANQFHDRANVDVAIEIARIFNRKVRHIAMAPAFPKASGEVAARGTIGPTVRLDRVALAGLFSAIERRGAADFVLGKGHMRSQKQVPKYV